MHQMGVFRKRAVFIFFVQPELAKSLKLTNVSLRADVLG
jgi:hypothetical protein